jgi:organic hydroperoxide reductase OsmC/OhrA
MEQYCAKVVWNRGEQNFSDNKYSRGHEWKFDGGLTVPASSAPSSVPLPLSVAENIDPEEALVAALSSCHMLFFSPSPASKALSLTVMKITPPASWKKMKKDGCPSPA